MAVYRKVDKFIDSIPEPARKRDAILAINNLASFPFLDWDLEKLSGRDDS